MTDALLLAHAGAPTGDGAVAASCAPSAAPVAPAAGGGGMANHLTPRMASRLRALRTRNPEAPPHGQPNEPGGGARRDASEHAGARKAPPFRAPPPPTARDDENIFAQNIVDDEAAEARGSDARQPIEERDGLKTAYRVARGLSRGLSLGGLCAAIIVSNFLAFRGTDAPVAAGLVLGVLGWVLMLLVPLLFDRELRKKLTGSKPTDAMREQLQSSASRESPGGGRAADGARGGGGGAEEGEESLRWGCAASTPRGAPKGGVLRQKLVTLRDAVGGASGGAAGDSRARGARPAKPPPMMARCPPAHGRSSATLRTWGAAATGTARRQGPAARALGLLRELRDARRGGGEARAVRSTLVEARACARDELRALMRALFRAYDSPSYWVSRTGRSVVWSLAYIWSSYYLVERDPATGYWDFTHVPRRFHLAVQISIWATSCDYVFEVFAAGGWQFVLSFGSLALLVQQPLFFVLIGWREHFGAASADEPHGGGGGGGGDGRFDSLGNVGSHFSDEVAVHTDGRAEFFLLQYGWLRFVELYLVNTTTLSKARVTSVRIQAVSLAIGILCILLTMAGSIHSFEAPSSLAPAFSSFDHFFYFSLVTITTVGYGDFYPTHFLSRTAAMAGIVMAVTWVPVQLRRLQAALAQQRMQLGAPPERSEPFVLLCGHISRTQLRVFFRQVAAHKVAFPSRFVVLSTAPLSELDVHNTLSRDEQRHTYLEQTDLLQSRALGTDSHRLALRNAWAVYVFNCGEQRADGGGGGGGARAQPADDDGDQQTTIRVLTLLTFVRPRRVCVQLQSLHNAAMLRTLGVQNLLCLSEMKMRWLGKSVTDCPGVITLLANLLHTDHELRRAHERSEGVSEFQREYLEGAACELFVHRLPAWAVGKAAHRLYDVMARVDGLILLGIKHGDLMQIWRGDFEVSAEHAGVWIGRDFEQVRAFCERSQPPPSLLTLAAERTAARKAGGGAGAADGAPHGQHARSSIQITSHIQCALGAGMGTCAGPRGRPSGGARALLLASGAHGARAGAGATAAAAHGGAAGAREADEGAAARGRPWSLGAAHGCSARGVVPPPAQTRLSIDAAHASARPDDSRTSARGGGAGAADVAEALASSAPASEGPPAAVRRQPTIGTSIALGLGLGDASAGRRHAKRGSTPGGGTTAAAAAASRWLRSLSCDERGSGGGAGRPRAAPERQPPPSSAAAEGGGAPRAPSPPAEPRTLPHEARRGVRIVLCGWPRNVEKLLEISARSPDVKFVIFAPVQPEHASLSALRPFQDKFVFVRGRPLDREELKPLILKPGLHSVIVFNEQLTAAAPLASPLDVVVCAANVESMLPPGQGRVQVLVSLSSSADMRFVDRTSWWPSSEDPTYGHVSSPTFASGTVIADEMLYPLMMGWYKHGLIEFCNKLTDSVLDPTEVRLVPAPSAKQFGAGVARPRSYGELVPPMMAAGMLPIALYRRRVGRSAKYMQPYVLTNPAHGTQLRSSDRVYVLMRNNANSVYSNHSSAAAASGRAGAAPCPSDDCAAGRRNYNYAASVKRLERAARTIQRHYRMAAEAAWEAQYWGARAVEARAAEHARERARARSSAPPRALARHGSAELARKLGMRLPSVGAVEVEYGGERASGSRRASAGASALAAAEHAARRRSSAAPAAPAAAAAAPRPRPQPGSLPWAEPMGEEQPGAEVDGSPPSDTVRPFGPDDGAHAPAGCQSRLASAVAAIVDI